MAAAKSFEDLDIWKSANEGAVAFYKISENDKIKNDWGLKDQIRRAAVSISNNIAEGFEYDHNPDFIRFLKYAKDSTGELRNQLILLKKDRLCFRGVLFRYEYKLTNLVKTNCRFNKIFERLRKK